MGALMGMGDAAGVASANDGMGLLSGLLGGGQTGPDKLGSSSATDQRMFNMGIGLMAQANGGGENYMMPLMQYAMSAPGGKKEGEGINLSEPGYNAKKPSLVAGDPATTSPNLTSGSLPGNDIISQLKAEIAKAFPNDPVRQQIALTQAIHESGLQDGTPSGLAQKGNYFGIKAPGSAGLVNMNTTENFGGQNQTVNAGFGANNSMADSINQYKNLMGKPRYKNVMAAKNPYDAFLALKAAGYATDPRYAQNLNRVYNSNVAPLYR